MKQIIFPHIHKTAGSSFISALVEPNLPKDRVYRYRSHHGLRHLMRDAGARNADFISGHVPYGLHTFTAREAVYVTFLRDPIDRAVSWYYWIKDLERIDLYRRHPLRNYADSVSIKEFYENPVHANTQTRYLAGLLPNKLYPHVRTSWFDARVLEKAKRHLRACVCFGLQERFEESLSWMMHTFGWQQRAQIERQRSTKKRPSVREIQELDPRIIDELRQYHHLDLAFYDFARALFDERVRQAGIRPAPASDPVALEKQR